MVAVLTLLALLAGHAIADTFLQPYPLSQAKRHRDPWIRWMSLAVHGTCHGFFVLLFTGMWQLGLAEVVSHALIDRGKGRGWYGDVTDQLLHVACKLMWVAMLAVT